MKLSWLEKLGRWQDALQIYERSWYEHSGRAPTGPGARGGGGAHADPRGGEFAMGRMRCLSALSEWQQLARVSDQVWPLTLALALALALPLALALALALALTLILTRSGRS